MAVRPPQTLFLYFDKRWCVAGTLEAPQLEREEFRSYGAARDWAESYLEERNGGQIHCHGKDGHHAITLKVGLKVGPNVAALSSPEPAQAGFRGRPSSLAERRT